MIRKVKGSITVFMSLILILLLAILCTTLESARVFGVRSIIATSCDVAGFSLFSQYNNKLLEDYELFLLEDTSDFTSQLQDYISYYENPYKGLNGIYGNNYYPFKAEQVDIKSLNYIMDHHAIGLEEEISDIMKDVKASEVLSQVSSSLGVAKNFDKISNYMNQWMEKSKDIVNVYNMATDAYKKYQSTKKKYEELKERINAAKNNIKEYHKALDGNNETLMDAYQSQLQVSVSNILNKKQEMIEGIEDANIDANLYIKKAKELNHSLAGIEVDDEVKVEGADEFLSDTNEEQKQMQKVSLNAAKNKNILNNLNVINANMSVEDLETTLGSWEEQLKEYQELELPEETQTSSDMKKFDLLDTVKQVMSDGALGLVVEDVNKLSERTFTMEDFPSKESLNSKESIIDKTKNAVLLNEYLLDYMPNYTTKDIESERYDLEYILAGKKSDKENLSAVAQRLILLRQAMNYMYLVTDTEKKMVAREMAMTVLGAASATVVAVPVVTTLILMAWSYAEAVSDVKALLSGKKIPLMKTKESWNLSLETATAGKEAWGEASENQKGLDYKGYSRILLYLQAKDIKLYRSLDMMQVHACEENPDFRIKNCIYRLEATAKVRIVPMFLSVPFMQNTTLDAKISYGY